MSQSKLLLIIVIAGLVCLNGVNALKIDALEKDVKRLAVENMICNQAKEDKVFIYLRCLKNSQDEIN